MMREHEFGTTHCVVCRQRITDSGWLPYCCEVCADSDEAYLMRLPAEAWHVIDEANRPPPT